MLACFEMSILGIELAQALLADLPERVKTRGAPDDRQLVDMVEKAFWASVRQEEGRDVTFSVSFFPVPEHRSEPSNFLFTNPRVFSSDNVAKLAPALDPVHEAMFVESTLSGLSIWGT